MSTTRVWGAAPLTTIGPRTDPRSGRANDAKVRFSSGGVDLRSYRASKQDLADFRSIWRRTSRQALEYYASAENRGAYGKGLEAEEYLAIVNYAAGPLPGEPMRTCYAMNKALRARDVRALDRIEVDIKVLSSALNKLPGTHQKTYRVSELAGPAIAAYQPGEIVTERAFMSTSVAHDESATNRAVWIVHGRGGGKNIEPIANREREILYPAGTRFEIIRRKTVVRPNAEPWQSRRFELIEMREVPDER